MKRSRLLLIASLLCSISIHAQTPRILSSGQLEIEALRGLDSVAVEVKSEVQQFNADEIRTAVERRLKDARLPVVSASRLHAARLLVTILERGGVTMARVQLLRLAAMDCEASGFFVSMWEREGLTEDPPAELKRLVDLFAADYNSLNRR